MRALSPSHSPVPKAPGVLQTALNKLVARTAEVIAVETVGVDFRLVTLVGEDLRNRSWTPGDMIQIAFGGWEARAYTPSAYDPTSGTIELLGYVHGGGIGSSWLESPPMREAFFLVGPRMALDLRAVRRPAVFFGDETSLSTAAAFLATSFGLAGVHFVFEVGSVDRSREALGRLGLRESITLIARAEGDRHLDQVEDRMRALFASTPDAHGVLTGKASSIQRLYKAARNQGISSKRMTNIAYWAPGKKGFSGIQR